MFLSKLINPKFVLTIICIFFLFTRFYRISEIPPSVYWDEASIGYNAFSIVQTGVDEWGDFFPIHFRAFGEFKLPVYIYTVAIFVKIFGLNEFSVRIPAVLFSLGSTIITYFLAKKLTDSATIGILSSFFMTISPWYFIFSRTGYEATAGLMFYLLGIYLFLSVKKNNWLLLLSILNFILSAYSYNSFRIITPLTVLILLNVKDIRSVIKKARVSLVISVVLLIVSALPIYRLYVYDAGISRFQALSTSNPTAFIKNYLSHFNLNFLLLGDKNLRSQQADFGQIYLPELILLPLGLIYICRKSKYNILLISLLLIGPIPSALTKESPHALRAISMVPFFSMLSVAGILQLKEFLKTKFIELGIVTIILLFFVNYFVNFINIYPAQASIDWQYGYKKIYLDFKNEFSKYNRIIISDEYAQPYIFALFYLKYDPNNFRNLVIRNDIPNWGFSTVSKFDKFEFGKVNKLLDNGRLNNSLIFASKAERIPGKIPVSSIKFLDGTTAFWVYQI